MMYATCDGGYISERMATYFDRLARDMKPYRYLLEMDEFDRDAITRFYDARIDHGPECVNMQCPS